MTYTGWGGFSSSAFIERFTTVNYGLWDQFNHGLIDKDKLREERFHKILHHFKVLDKPLSLKISDAYLKLCPTKTNLFPYTHDVLTYLQSKYQLYILTNGFNDVQQIKINSSNLTSYFKGVITSDSIGYKKPNKEIFDHALEVAGIANYEGLMVGDNLNADIRGARNADIASIYFNPERNRHKEKQLTEISCLSELMNIL
ncbi:YjjG family noncanonical pyrimidine nucleotidase [Fulvivirga maritima]|uniref:YjjG family noncanonical pyrimidine nucleotidase n=1 Tax=Fulvivirga maritima TaxID=2904247 RepID=UPI001F1AB152|nr:YjjG family noncanonical pyrimidine nucleotidase [Fulvivirga maritima]UII27668.1 YjjG family noncanonical pyrimidine nucleotidase [Fulvivirga maritima]